MNRTDKSSFVSDLRERITKAPVVYLTDFSGLDVKSITQLRRSLRESGAEYVVVKNRLAKLAFDETDLPNIFEGMTGPTGMVLGGDDVVAPAKALTDFAKGHDKKPVFKLGILENEVLHPEQIDRLAKPVPCRRRWLCSPRLSKGSFRRWPASSMRSSRSASRQAVSARIPGRFQGDAGASLVSDRVNPIAG
jgi:large subunit ribosomal protein L10